MEYVFHLFPCLKEREKQQGALPSGEQQMLDEPSLGIAPIIAEDIFRALHQINQDGLTLLRVEQNCNVALDIASRGYVIEIGEIILSDTARNLPQNEIIQKSYMGME